MPSSDPRFYYLTNFERALEWVAERYDDLLAPSERGFVHDFPALPRAARALLVRMLMRKGTVFRSSRLVYEEIGPALDAAAPLAALGWIDPEPTLALDALFALLTKAELLDIFRATAGVGPSMSKTSLRDTLRAGHPDAFTCLTYRAWRGLARGPAGRCASAPRSASPRPLIGEEVPARPPAEPDERVLEVTIAPLCERLRLMFFGNLHQTWSEFVLADLGIFQYERVAFDASSRAFQTRDDIEGYLRLQQCRDALDAADEPELDLEPLLAAVDGLAGGNAWLEARRARLLFHIGQYCERREDWPLALAIYRRCADPGARHRSLRVLERSGRFDEALPLALEALAAPRSEEESQRIARMLPRLRRKLRVATPSAQADETSRSPPHQGQAPTTQPSSSYVISVDTFPSACPAQADDAASRPRARAPVDRVDLILPRPAEPARVEHVVRDHLSRDGAPVHYVENTLINSLFGLLCWPAIFAAVPGAFFHPFQSGPADLHAHDFRARRAASFEACLGQLASTQYRETIARCFAEKAGLQSPFVSWGLLTPELLAQALDCLPAAHLRACFERLLSDVRANRSGLPDLVQFWPAERRYALIEVKGPGDRLQDNQQRWLDYCAMHAMPVKVLHLQWAPAPGMDAHAPQHA